MSVIRLVMVDGSKAESGLVPSSSIPGILYAVGKGAGNIQSFWEKIRDVEPALHDHFTTNHDPLPLLEGTGDGLLVISWDFYCIESFQAYMPVRPEGQLFPHNGQHRLTEERPIKFSINDTWHLVDHHFEESRH